ncbi:HlyD family secretion protein [Rhizobium sp. ZPR3]|uniref:HlyD family secretion protein n=2 Tax=unclassified Rhizobium TaxID=2613769 RepID=A0AAU7SQT9_9HYPH
MAGVGQNVALVDGRANDARDKPNEAIEMAAPQTRPPADRRLIHRVLAIVLLVVLVVCSGWFWRYWTEGRFIQSTNDAFLQADQTAIAPKVQGYVETVYVTSNQKVSAGDKLLKIRSQDYEAKVNQAEAALEASKADLVRAIAEAKRQVSAVGQAEAQLASAHTQAKFAQSQVDRYQSLGKSGATSSEQVANYISQRDQANAQVNIAEASLASSKEAINTADAAVKQSEAAVKQSEAQLASAKLDLDATIVIAPIAGTVGDKTVTVGQYVQAGTRLMTLVPVEDLYLEANFKETQIELMRVGQPAMISIDAISSTSLHGTVESFAPGTGAQFALIPAENATGNFTKIVQRVPVRIKVEAGSEAREILVPGLSVTVDVDTRGARKEQSRLAEQETDSKVTK